MRGIEMGRLLAAGFLMLAVSASGAFAQAQQQPLLGESDEPIEIESDRLEVREQENIAIFTGNVSLVQGNLLLRTVRMTVHYTSTSEDGGSLSSAATEVERIEAEGKVYLKSGEQVATGDKGSFDMRSDLMVLTGEEVVLTEGDNVVRGCKLTMRMSSGESEVDGCGDQGGRRVQMLLQPSGGGRQ